MEIALIGLIGVILGVLLTEYFRQNNRIELYSQPIFKKRLEVYEQFYNKLCIVQETAIDIMEKPKYSKIERFKIWSSAVLDIAQFLDQNKLYLDENITVHCMMTLMDVEQIYDLVKENRDEGSKVAREFSENFSKLISMIKAETGLSAMENLFKGITKTKHKSDFIKEYQIAKSKYEKNKEEG